MSLQKTMMTLPAITHIDKLQSIAQQIFQQIQLSTKELHMLRGSIDQMSYMTRTSNNQLNDFLIGGMASLNKQLSEIQKGNLAELKKLKTQVNGLGIEYQNLERDVGNQNQYLKSVEVKVGHYL